MVQRLRCPTPEEIMKLLESKRRLSKLVYKWDPEYKRYVFDVAPIVDYANHLFNGRLQRIDESLEPDDNAYFSILSTVPGLLTCLHWHLYRRGKLKNEILALEGPGGIGKSTIGFYLAKWLKGVFITPEDNIAHVLKLLFTMKVWRPIIVFDDAPNIVSKYWLWDREERRKALNLFKALEYARDIAGIILLTARTYSGVAKRLRDLATLVGRMERVVVAGEYIIDVIFWREAGQPQHVRPVYIDVVWPGIQIPRDEYVKQLERRRRIAVKTLEEIDEDSDTDVNPDTDTDDGDMDW